MTKMVGSGILAAADGHFARRQVRRLQDLIEANQ
jgi:hypothetical protein